MCSVRRHLNVRRLAGTRRQDHDLSSVLIELQRADAGGETGRQVVPGPTRSQAFVVEGTVVADNPAVDPLDTKPLQRRSPFGEACGCRPVPIVESRIAGADDDHVSLEDAVFDWSEGPDACAI